MEPDEDELFYENVPTSKKPAQMRRKELLSYLKPSIIYVCSKYANELLRSRNGCRVISEVISCFRADIVSQAVSKAVCGLDIHDLDLSQFESVANEEGNEGADGEEEEAEEEQEEGDYDGEEAEDYEGEELPEDGYEEDEAKEEEVAEDEEAAKAKAEAEEINSKSLPEIAFVVAALKYLIAIDNWIESGKSATAEIASIVSSGLWESEENNSFSSYFVESMKEADTSAFSTFLSGNKSAALLVDLSNIASLKSTVVALLTQHRAAVEGANQEHENVKALGALISQPKAAPKSATKQTPKGKSKN